MTVTTDPVIVTQTGSLAVVAPAIDPDQGVLATADTTRTVVEYLASAITGLHKISDRWVQITSTVSDDGHLTVDLQRVRFGDDDCAVRMVLSPTIPMPITAR